MVRTTVSLDSELYQELKASYEELGFRRLNDLVGVALKEFLRRRRAEEYDRLMREAAEDDEYRKILSELNQVLTDVDGLPPY